MNQAKPLWAEGLFLRPQHFQRQDAYAEALSRIYEMPVKAKYLYFFQLGRFVEV